MNIKSIEAHRFDDLYLFCHIFPYKITLFNTLSARMNREMGYVTRILYTTNAVKKIITPCMFQAYFWLNFLFFCVLQKKKKKRKKKDLSFQVVPITEDEEGVIYFFKGKIRHNQAI